MSAPVEKFTTEIGSPNELVSAEHKTKNSAVTRLLKTMEDLRSTGSWFNRALQEEAESAIEQIKGTNLDYLPVGEWRGWTAKDPDTGYTAVVRVRRNR